jgi:hypothetical protein
MPNLSQRDEIAKRFDIDHDSEKVLIDAIISIGLHRSYPLSFDLFSVSGGSLHVVYL